MHRAHVVVEPGTLPDLLHQWLVARLKDGADGLDTILAEGIHLFGAGDPVRNTLLHALGLGLFEFESEQLIRSEFGLLHKRQSCLLRFIVKLKHGLDLAVWLLALADELG